MAIQLIRLETPEEEIKFWMRAFMKLAPWCEEEFSGRCRVCDRHIMQEGHAGHCAVAKADDYVEKGIVKV